MRVLIVDDHEGFRRIAALLLVAAGHEVVGEAADGRSALDAVRDLDPELLLLDVQLPDIDGFAVAEALAQSSPAPLVVLVSTRSAEDYAQRLASSPARGFIGKDRLSAQTLAATIGG